MTLESLGVYDILHTCLLPEILEYNKFTYSMITHKHNVTNKTKQTNLHTQPNKVIVNT